MLILKIVDLVVEGRALHDVGTEATQRFLFSLKSALLCIYLWCTQVGCGDIPLSIMVLVVGLAL